MNEVEKLIDRPQDCFWEDRETDAAVEPYINTCIKCGSVFESEDGCEALCNKCKREKDERDREYMAVKERFARRQAEREMARAFEKSIEQTCALAAAEGVSYGAISIKPTSD